MSSMFRSKPPLYGGEEFRPTHKQADGAPSQISPALVAAYRKTRYEVRVAPPFDQYIDRPCTRLAQLMAWHGVRTAATITAWNPQSRLTAAEENALRQDGLVTELDRLGLAHLPVFGHDPAGKWPGEESRLVLGIGCEDIIRLGRAFDQNAVTLAQGDQAVPRLLLLR
jgi:hypothetical protein